MRCGRCKYPRGEHEQHRGRERQQTAEQQPQAQRIGLAVERVRLLRRGECPLRLLLPSGAALFLLLVLALQLFLALPFAQLVLREADADVRRCRRRLALIGPDRGLLGLWRLRRDGREAHRLRRKVGLLVLLRGGLRWADRFGLFRCRLRRFGRFRRRRFFRFHRFGRLRRFRHSSGSWFALRPAAEFVHDVLERIFGRRLGGRRVNMQLYRFPRGRLLFLHVRSGLQMFVTPRAGGRLHTIVLRRRRMHSGMKYCRAWEY